MAEKPSDSNNKYGRVEEAIRESEARYHSLFEDSPISLWEEDFSEVKNYIDYLKKTGITDLRTYFNNRPEEVSKCAKMVKISDVNKATLELLEAQNKEELYSGLSKIFTQESLDIFKEEIITLANGELKFEAEAPHLTLKNNIRYFIVRLILVPEYSETWSKVFISLSDITSLKKTRDKLRISQENLRIIFNSINDYLFVLEFNGQILNVNKAVLDRLGYSLNEIEKMNVVDLHPPDRRKEAEKVVKMIIEGELDYCEIPIMTKKGKLIPVETVVTNTRLGDKNVIIGISRDISERIKAEIKIKESEQKYRNLFEKSPSSIILIDSTGRIVDANPSCLRLIGYEKSELIGKKYAKINIVLPEYIPILLERLKKVIKNEEIPPIDIQIKKKNGNIVWVTFLSTLITIGEKKFIQTIGYDISERKKAQRELQISEDKYRNLFKNSPFPILLVDESGTVLDANPAVEATLGYGLDEITNKNLTTLPFIPEKYMDILQKRRKSLLSGKEQPKMDIKLIKKNRRRIWISFESSILELEGKKVIQLIGNDVTQRIKSQEELMKASESSRFYQDLFTHDMKNILQGISSSVELYSLYKDNPEKADEIDEILTIIKDQTERGSNLIKNVLKLSKVEESKIPIERTEIMNYLNESIEFLRNSFPNKDINIEISAKEKQYHAKANDLLLDVFENILINSIKHNDNDKIEILIEISTQKRRRKKYVKIQFKDNGRGIPDNVKEKLFQRLSNKERSVSGSGLGLSLIKVIMDGYKGDISIQNRIRGDYRKGSNFILFLPAAE